MEEDDYIFEYYTNKYNDLSRPPYNRFLNINYNKLSFDKRKLNIPIKIKISNELIITNTIEWDLSESKNPYKFADILISNFTEEEMSKEYKDFNLKEIPCQIRDKIITHIDENTFFNRVRLVKTENYESSNSNSICGNCGSIKYNNDYCVNCMLVFDKRINENRFLLNSKIDPNNLKSFLYNTNNKYYSNYNIYSSLDANNLNTNANLNSSTNLIADIVHPIKNKFETKPTKRQEKIEMMNKQKEDENNDGIVNYTISENKNEYILPNNKIRKCKSCGESYSNNKENSNTCRKCNHVFSIDERFNINIYCCYSLNYWNKLSNHSTMQQLKDFQYYFNIDDFDSIRILYSKIINVLHNEYKEILTDEAFEDLEAYVNKLYNIYNKPNKIVNNIFNKVNSTYILNPTMNFNNLKDCIEGNLKAESYLNSSNKSKQIYLLEDEDISSDNNNNNVNALTNINSLLGRKRGRPKKLEIFKSNVLENNKEEEIIGIKLEDKIKILLKEINPAPYKHYEFCGKCKADGKLLYCESCSSSYHYDCLYYERPPKGKFKCYFCKIIKFGISKTVFVDYEQVNIMDKLQKKLKNLSLPCFWTTKCKQLLEAIYAHPCSILFREDVNDNIKNYCNNEENSKKPKLIKINHLYFLDNLKKKLDNKIYENPQNFVDEVFDLLNFYYTYYDNSSFVYKQSNILIAFLKYLIVEEKVFEDKVFIFNNKIKNNFSD